MVMVGRGGLVIGRGGVGGWVGGRGRGGEGRGARERAKFRTCDGEKVHVGERRGGRGGFHALALAALLLAGRGRS